MHVRGMVRLYLVEGFPNLKLYVSPIQIDPRAPVVPISSPPDYSADLASRIGLFHTIGMPEETWALNEGQMTDDGWLDMEATILHEREAMFFDTLAQNDSRLIVQVFVQTDRTSHMFWRGIDEQHPLHAQTSERGKGAIRWIYGEADRILGKTMAQMRPEDRLIVLSDHGFAPWRWGDQSEPLAGRQRLHGHQARAAQFGAAVRQRQLDQDPGLRHRPERHLPQPSRPRGSRHRARRSGQGDQARHHRQAGRSEGSGNRRAVHAHGLRWCRDLCRAEDGRRARSRRRLRARLSRVLADRARRRAREARRAERPQMERRPLHRAVEGARHPVHLVPGRSAGGIDRRTCRS